MKTQTGGSSMLNMVKLKATERTTGTTVNMRKSMKNGATIRYAILFFLISSNVYFSLPFFLRTGAALSFMFSDPPLI